MVLIINLADIKEPTIPSYYLALIDSDNMPAYLVALTPTSPDCGRTGSANSAHMLSRADVVSPASSRDASHDAAEVRRTGYYFSSSAESASASRHEDSIEVVQINVAQPQSQQQPSKLAQPTAFPRQQSDAQVASSRRNYLQLPSLVDFAWIKLPLFFVGLPPPQSPPSPQQSKPDSARSSVCL